MSKILLQAAIALAAAASVSLAGAVDDVTFSANIKPIFEKSCVRCHGDGKAKARLRLDSLENVLKGGENGKVIKPGESAASILVKSISYQGPKDKHMPPPNNKANIARLTEEQVAMIRTWVNSGAK